MPEMETRTEVGFLRKRRLLKAAYYGIKTLTATENFPAGDMRAPLEFVYAYVYVKKAVATTNVRIGWLNEKIDANGFEVQHNGEDRKILLRSSRLKKRRNRRNRMLLD